MFLLVKKYYLYDKLLASDSKHTFPHKISRLTKHVYISLCNSLVSEIKEYSSSQHVSLKYQTANLSCSLCIELATVGIPSRRLLIDSTEDCPPNRHLCGLSLQVLLCMVVFFVQPWFIVCVWELFGVDEFLFKSG